MCQGPRHFYHEEWGMLITQSLMNKLRSLPATADAADAADAAASVAIQFGFISVAFAFTLIFARLWYLLAALPFASALGFVSISRLLRLLCLLLLCFPLFAGSSGC